MTASDFWAGAEVIHVYTRAQGVEDGVLVDLTEWAHETGFKYPLAVTRAVWEEMCEWTDEDEKRKPSATGQDVRGRAHDVLWMLLCAIRRQQGDTTRIPFTVLRVPREGRGLRPRPKLLVGVCGPGDTAEPVITVMFPGED